MQMLKRSKFSSVHKLFIAPYVYIKKFHTPVMVKEVVRYLSPGENNIFIDMTFGSGGHTKALLELQPSLKMICLDRDPVAYSKAIEMAENFSSNVIPCLGKFSELPEILKKLNISENSVDGILFDFGCSSLQFDTAERGFSLSKDGHLDMRMDGKRFPDSPTAYDILSLAEEHDLMKIFKIYGEEKLAKKIARAIVEARYSFKQVKTTTDLARLVENACLFDSRSDKLQRPAHVSTKIFQALRIFVNNELNEINFGMTLAYKYLKVNGRLVTISFHSLEDRIVKRHLCGNVLENVANPLPLEYCSNFKCHDQNFLESLNESNWKLILKHVLGPTDEEVASNPRSRSAKLRAAIKCK